MKRKATLCHVENNAPITQKDAEFLYNYQESILLALKQAGTLTQMQYRHTAEKLARQAGLPHSGSK